MVVAPINFRSKPIKRYSEGHRDDCVHLGDAGNVLLQDMVGGLVEHISDQNIHFDLDDLMNQTVRPKIAHSELLLTV